MPTAGDQVPGGTTDMTRRLAALEREVRELRAARRLESASIGAGGLRIVEGGRLAMDTPGGRRMVDVGTITNPAYDHADGVGQQAIFFRREDGTLFFACFAVPAAGNGETQAWTFYDRTGNAIFAEDTTSGTGIAKPWMALVAPTNSDTTKWPASVTGAFSTIATSYNVKWQPNLRVFAHTAAVGAATGEVQLLIEGVQWGPTVAAGTSFDFTGPFDSVDIGNQYQIEVQARRLTGTGSIAAQVRMIHGK